MSQSEVRERVARAAAVAEEEGPSRALELLAQIDPAEVTTYYPYWVIRAHLLRDTRIEPSAGISSIASLKSADGECSTKERPMCPACISTATIVIAASATSAGGLFAWIGRKLYLRRSREIAAAR
jgi:hypothetical protein